MTIETITDRIAQYLVGTVAANVQSPITKFALGAAASASGKRMIAQKLSPLLAVIADESGDIDAAALKDMLQSGMKSAGKMPILGGLVTLDERDVEKFCEGL